jgi:hypothetical protein
MAAFNDALFLSCVSAPLSKYAFSDMTKKDQDSAVFMISTAFGFFIRSLS